MKIRTCLYSERKRVARRGLCCVASLLLFALGSGEIKASVVVNEIMQNPDAVSDASGEWFELFNTGGGPIDIDGWTIEDNDFDDHVIANGGPLVVPGHGFVVLARNGDPGTNGGVVVDYVYGNDIELANTSDELVIRNAALVEVDRVEWDDGATFPDPTGASMELARDQVDQNHLGMNWCEATSTFGGGDLGTPGAANDCCMSSSCYYEFVDISTPESFRASLHDLIDDHARVSWDSTWAVLELADQTPGDMTTILDVYKNEIFPVGGGGYSREHSWPSSYGFPNESDIPYSDCHAVFLADSSYNSSRLNNPFDTCDPDIYDCEERPTVFNNGQGGPSGGEYPGNSNWRVGSGPITGRWEPWVGRRGDIARALFYMDVRYEGDVEGEPDLVLTNSRDEIAASTGEIGYMGIHSVLLGWHEQDPVTPEPPVQDQEMWRNEVVFAAQGNRNPFIDHPEWVACLYLGPCGIFADDFESGDTSAWSSVVP